MAVEGLGVAIMTPATLEPTLCKIERLAGILTVGGTGSTFVESHHDIGTDSSLYIDHILRCKKMLRTIDVAAEMCALLGKFAVLAQREYLKSAAICKDRALPAVEPVQTTGTTNYIHSRV